ncbi:MAG TPA: hypothetical protein VEA16_07265, partial [Vicinamibacterales bacterium]|nr:hypothetical protein [Vicinamibacterales bacterium]
MDGTAVTFDKVFVLGPVDRAAIPPSGAIEMIASDTVAGTGHLPVDEAIRWVRDRKQRTERALLLTDRDLFIPECASLFGFADVKHRVALVSTARLATTDVEQTRRRVQNAIQHEAAHLDGLRHCRRHCLMRAATDATELDARPMQPCGYCPRPLSMLPKIAIVLGVAWMVTLFAGRFIDRVPLRPREAPAIPALISGTFAEVPWDPADLFARPVSVIAQDLGRAVVERAPIVTDVTLPPGLDAAALTRLASASTSVLFRTPYDAPVVHVHVLELRTQRDDLAATLGCGPLARGTAYDTCHVRRDDADVHLLTAGAERPGRRAIVVYSPAASGRDMAERLAASVGTGGGLLRDADISVMLHSLPAQLPAGLTMQTLIVSNLHRVPESVERLTSWI